ncbi:hypothetical protein [Bacillus sp. AFS017336]|uniref:hypothetical protein n=1 Tax=Bacillus sp. AFS017336 TaxID=2033489 RepID=UPI00211D3D26|nr:hypothetical protein [Bacillus sp. AFS017336]
MDYLTRSQLQLIHSLKSDRNARRILTQMSDRINVKKDGKCVYYLNSKGREIVNCPKVRKGTGNIDHYIMRNTIYIAYGMPNTWKNEVKMTSKGRVKSETVSIVSDALFKQEKTLYIVEVDNTQTMAKNRIKMDKYRTLINRGSFGQNQPYFVWITTSDLKRKQLSELCNDLPHQIFLASDFA